MKKEDKLYIESYLAKVVSICLRANYKVDKFGNTVIKDKNKIKQMIHQLIKESMKKIEGTEDEIRNYLIQVYQEKSENPEFAIEGRELIDILEMTKKVEKEKKIKSKQPKEEEIR